MSGCAAIFTIRSVFGGLISLGGLGLSLFTSVVVCKHYGPLRPTLASLLLISVLTLWTLWIRDGTPGLLWSHGCKECPLLRRITTPLLVFTQATSAWLKVVYLSREQVPGWKLVLTVQALCVGLVTPLTLQLDARLFEVLYEDLLVYGGGHVTPYILLVFLTVRRHRGLPAALALIHLVCYLPTHVQRIVLQVGSPSTTDFSCTTVIFSLDIVNSLTVGIDAAIVAPLLYAYMPELRGLARHQYCCPREMKHSVSSATSTGIEELTVVSTDERGDDEGEQDMLNA